MPRSKKLPAKRRPASNRAPSKKQSGQLKKQTPADGAGQVIECIVSENSAQGGQAFGAGIVGDCCSMVLN
jgi:hypothetical protein